MSAKRIHAGPPTVVLRMDVEHAQALCDLLDLATRIHIGQIDEIAVLARTGTISVRDDGVAGNARRAEDGEVDAIEDAAGRISALLGHTRGSFGIGSLGTGIPAKRGYEIMKAVRKTLHDHLRPDVRFHVHGDGVMCRYAPGRVPTSSIETTETI